MKPASAFIPGTFYADRNNETWKCVPAIFGSLPEFVSKKDGRRIVRTHDGRYRFDDTNHSLDIVRSIGESDE